MNPKVGVVLSAIPLNLVKEFAQHRAKPLSYEQLLSLAFLLSTA